MIKNKYIIQNDIVLVYCDNIKDKDIITKVSVNTFNDKMKDFNVKWFAKWNEHTSSYYIQCTKYMGSHKNGKTIFLHRFLTNAKQGEYVDHINHDTIDNTDNNLRKISDAENCKNRMSKNSNNKSGYRNVCLIQNWWYVQIMIDGKNQCIAKFRNVDDAGKFAEYARQKYYGEFAGDN